MKIINFSIIKEQASADGNSGKKRYETMYAPFPKCSDTFFYENEVKQLEFSFLREEPESDYSMFSEHFNNRTEEVLNKAG